jgi:hypothetical protein
MEAPDLKTRAEILIAIPPDRSRQEAHQLRSPLQRSGSPLRKRCPTKPSFILNRNPRFPRFHHERLHRSGLDTPRVDSGTLLCLWHGTGMTTHRVIRNLSRWEYPRGQG